MIECAMCGIACGTSQVPIAVGAVFESICPECAHVIARRRAADPQASPLLTPETSLTERKKSVYDVSYDDRYYSADRYFFTLNPSDYPTDYQKFKIHLRNE